MAWQAGIVDKVHANQVLELFLESFGHPMSLEHWHWKYLQQHSLAEQSPSFSIGVWGRRGNLIGHAGALIFAGWQPTRTVSKGSSKHRPTEIVGRPRWMIQIVDVMVKPSVRGPRQGGLIYQILMERLKAHLIEQFPGALVYGFPGLRPFRLGERLGFYQHLQSYHLVPLQISGVVGSGFAGLMLEPTGWLSGIHEVSDWWCESVRYHDVPMVIRDKHYLGWRFKDHPSVSYQLWRVKKRMPWWRQTIGWLVTCPWQGNSHALVDFIFRDGSRHPSTKQECLNALAQKIGRSRRLYAWDVPQVSVGNVVVAMSFKLAPQSGEQQLLFPGAEVPRDRLLFLPADTDVF